MRHLHRAQRADYAEPHHHHRAEHAAHRAGATALHGEQRHDHHRGQRQHGLLSLGQRNLNALNGRKHRNGRRDHAIAEQQAGAADADQRDGFAHARIHGAALRQRHQRQYAAFAAVIRAHDQQHVLDRHDQEQRPEYQRQAAKDFAIAGMRVGKQRQHALQRVQRAGADVAVNHAQHANQRAQFQSRPHQLAGVRRYGSGRHERGVMGESVS